MWFSLGSTPPRRLRKAKLPRGRAAWPPPVQDHLEKCGDCREEYEALLTALRAEQGWTPVRLIWARLRQFFRTDRRGA
jgi:hypothetical protein